ncbi:MAG TPA: hypothetical protein VMG12_04295 [Polyangiaceae bacterium]|nr:hypothetical protein [Polyangiaceae bacterium]
MQQPARPSAEGLSRWRELAPALIAGAGFSAFVVYFGLLCLRPEWGGDFQMYCAGIARLYRDMLHPLHEAVAVPSSQSTVYTVYLVAVAAVGKLLALTPFHVLQLTGVVNLFVLVGAVCYLFSRVSLHRRWWLPAACFLFCMLWVHWRHYGWSSALMATGLQYLQAYPSTFGWSAAFVSFGLMADLARRARPRDFAALVAVLAVLLLTHVLTASWVVGIGGLFALQAAWQRRSFQPLACAALVLALALVPALVWPYSAFFGQQSMVGVKEGAPFGGFPWNEFPLTYAIGLGCLAYLWWRLRQHGFWVVALVATLAALGVWHIIHFEFGDRYALFALFPLQLATAEVMAMAIFVALELPAALPVPLRRWEKPALLAALAVIALGWLPSPMAKIARQPTGWGRLPSVASILERPPQHDAYYQAYAPMSAHLGEADIVLTPVSRAVFDIASVTGASSVAAPNAWSVPDRLARIQAVSDFFNPKTTPSRRIEIAQQWHATRVLVPKAQFNLLPALTQTFGPALYRDDQKALLGIEPAPPA